MAEADIIVHTPCTKRLPAEAALYGMKAESGNSDKPCGPNETFSVKPGGNTMAVTGLQSLYNDGPKSEAEQEKAYERRKLIRSSPPRTRSMSALSTPSKVKSVTKQTNTFQTPKLEQSFQSHLSDSPSPSPLRPHSSVRQSEKKAPTKSPFFSPPASAKKVNVKTEKKPRPKAGTVSCIPFPPLESDNFGLLQEKLAHDPFRLLIGVTFLNRTHGKYAIPVFFELMEKYPTPTALLASRRRDIIAIIRHLGLQAKRTDTYIEYARLWTYDPPTKGRRYRVDHYPSEGDGMDIRKDEVVDDDDPRTAWEIGHITQGRYAIDSWRIFCRDVLRCQAKGWNGEGREGTFQPEWMRVLPQDKELRAVLRWLWLKEGYNWDPVTGEKEPASKELQEAAMAGNIAWDDEGGIRILTDAPEESLVELSEGSSACALKTLEEMAK